MDKWRVEPTIFFIEKISFSLKLFSGHFYGQSFIKTVRGPLGDYSLCVYFMTGTQEGSTKSGFMEKLGIELATPGLQGLFS